jgi:hypothetical protein
VVVIVVMGVNAYLNFKGAESMLARPPVHDRMECSEE